MPSQSLSWQLSQSESHLQIADEQNARDCVSFLPPKDNKMLRN